MIKKTCSLCKKTKPLSSFNKKGKGLNSYCKDCNKKYHKEHYRKNKEKYLEKSRIYRKKIRDFVKEIKEKTPCIDCGIQYPSYVMDFDHTRGKKEFNVGQGDKKSIRLVKIEIKKCDIVCANCHRIRTYKRRMALSSSQV